MKRARDEKIKTSSPLNHPLRTFYDSYSLSFFTTTPLCYTNRVFSLLRLLPYPFLRRWGRRNPSPDPFPQVLVQLLVLVLVLVQLLVLVLVQLLLFYYDDHPLSPFTTTTTSLPLLRRPHSLLVRPPSFSLLRRPHSLSLYYDDHPLFPFTTTTTLSLLLLRR